MLQKYHFGLNMKFNNITQQKILQFTTFCNKYVNGLKTNVTFIITYESIIIILSVPVRQLYVLTVIVQTVP